MIIKVRQIISYKLITVISLILLCSCNKKEHSKSDIALTQATISTIQVVTKNDVVLKPNLGLVYYNEKPFTGTTIQNYDNGVEAESIEYLNGKKEGAYKKWFTDGQLSFESFYVNGKHHGTTKTWWKNGLIRSEANYKEGIAHGIQKQWYNTGEKFKELTIVNGKEEGLQKAWRKNGKIYNNYEAKNGRIFGLKRATLCYELEDEKVQTTKL